MKKTLNDRDLYVALLADQDQLVAAARRRLSRAVRAHFRARDNLADELRFARYLAADIRQFDQEAAP